MRYDISFHKQHTNDEIKEAYSPSTSDQLHFHEFSLDEKIKQASVIAIATYEPSPDGRIKAVIREFLKKEPNTIIRYKVGDEYASGSFYPNESQRRNTDGGVVVFFVGSPALVQYSVSYSGDRIAGLSDIPVKLLRKKCDSPSEQSANAAR